MQDLSILEERIGYKFADRKLLERAVTHRSFAAQHNERLEFLGDSVLNCVVGYALFQRDKHFTEGDLSRVRANLVCERTLAVIAKQIDVSAFHGRRRDEDGRCASSLDHGRCHGGHLRRRVRRKRL